MALNGGKLCIEVRNKLMIYKEKDGSAAAIFTPSNHECYDLQYCRTSGCKKSVCAHRCHKIAIGLS